MLTGGWRNESGRQKAQQELEQIGSLLSKSRRQRKICFGGSAEGVRVGVVTFTIAILITVAVYVALAAIPAAAAAAISFAVSYIL